MNDPEHLLRIAYSWTKEHIQNCIHLSVQPNPPWFEPTIAYFEGADDRFAAWVPRYEAMVQELMADFGLNDHNARAILSRTATLYLGDTP